MIFLDSGVYRVGQVISRMLQLVQIYRMRARNLKARLIEILNVSTSLSMSKRNERLKGTLEKAPA